MPRRIMNVMDIREIPGRPGYSVTRDGRVFGPRGRELKRSLMKNGYLMSGGALVHRLVLLAWVGPPPTPQHETAHENGVKTDNRVENLAWKTHKENCADRARHGTDNRGLIYNNKLTPEQVEEIKTASGTQAEIAARYGISQSQVSRIRNGKRWSGCR